MRRLRSVGVWLVPLGVIAAVTVISFSGYGMSGVRALSGVQREVSLPLVANHSALTKYPLATAGAAIPTPTPTPPIVSLGGTSHLGIWLGNDASQSTVQDVKVAGGRWTTFGVSWKTSEPTLTNPPTYDFSAFDTQLAEAWSCGGCYVDP